MGVSASLGGNHYCSYGEACQPAICLPASLLQSFLQNNRVPHSFGAFSKLLYAATSLNSRIANVRPFIPASKSALQPCFMPQSFQPSINQMDAWTNGIAGNQDDEDVIFLCFCGQLLRIWHSVLQMPSRVGSTLLRRKTSSTQQSFHSDQAVNPHTHSQRPYYFVTIELFKYFIFTNKFKLNLKFKILL